MPTGQTDGRTDGRQTVCRRIGLNPLPAVNVIIIG